jgi:ParB-like chromosome segregation protein Spo0J
MSSLKVVDVPISKIADCGYNPRTITDAGLDRLRKSLNEFGLVEPLIVNDRRAARWKGDTKMVLVAGHQRLKLLKDMGRAAAPCVVVALAPAKEKALNLRMNRHDGAWDEDQLVMVLRDTGDVSLDIQKELKGCHP